MTKIFRQLLLRPATTIDIIRPLVKPLLSCKVLSFMWNLYEQATFQRPSPETLQVSLTGALRIKVDNHGANVMVALYENGLVTNCTKGENKGKVLPNDFVVRKLEKLCSVKDITPKKTVRGTVNFSLWEGFNSSKCRVAVFLQNGSHQIFGAQNFQLPENL